MDEKGMKLFVAALSVIALMPLPAIAKPYSEILNAPPCYMVTSSGQLIDLMYMCGGNQGAIATQPNITASDICKAFASDVLNAQNQFQRDRANEGLQFCLANKNSIQADIDSGK